MEYYGIPSKVGLKTKVQNVGQIYNQYQSVFFSQANLERTLRWSPGENDVIICGSPCCGQDLLSRLVQKLVTDKSDPVVWLESVATPPEFFKEVPKSGSRVLKTSLTQESLRNTVFSSAARFLVIFREPVQARLVQYQDVSKYYEDAQQLPGSIPQTLKSLDADAFAKISPLHIGAWTRHDRGIYERNMQAWLNCRHDPRVKIIFYEKLVQNPEEVVRDLASFLQSKRSLSDTQIQSLCENFLDPKDLESLRVRSNSNFSSQSVSHVRQLWIDSMNKDNRWACSYGTVYLELVEEKLEEDEESKEEEDEIVKVKPAKSSSYVDLRKSLHNLVIKW